MKTGIRYRSRVPNIYCRESRPPRQSAETRGCNRHRWGEYIPRYTARAWMIR